MIIHTSQSKLKFHISLPQMMACFYHTWFLFYQMAKFISLDKQAVNNCVLCTSHVTDIESTMTGKTNMARALTEPPVQLQARIGNLTHDSFEGMSLFIGLNINTPFPISKLIWFTKNAKGKDELIVRIFAFTSSNCLPSITPMLFFFNLYSLFGTNVSSHFQNQKGD